MAMKVLKRIPMMPVGIVVTMIKTTNFLYALSISLRYFLVCLLKLITEKKIANIREHHQQFYTVNDQILNIC